MDIQTAAKTIQLILAPAVMVTACGILLSGMLGHYAEVNDRIRSLTAERIDLALLAPLPGHEHRAEERLNEIDHQVPMLTHRHRQVHHAILLGYAAVTVLVASMFVIGAAALAHSSVLGTVALFVFLGGTAAMLAGGWFMAVEIRTSQVSVAFEAMRVVHLPVSWSQSTGAGTEP
jgi:hypothetical protein